MAKKVLTTLKLQLRGGRATPAPPVGPALGQHEAKVGQFCTEFNDRTHGQVGEILPVKVTIYEDKSFSFIVGQPTTASLLKKAAEIRKGSGTPNTENVGFITQDQLEQIARIKMVDLNTSNLVAAMRTIAGTARSMGIEIRE